MCALGYETVNQYHITTHKCHTEFCNIQIDIILVISATKKKSTNHKLSIEIRETTHENQNKLCQSVWWKLVRN